MQSVYLPWCAHFILLFELNNFFRLVLFSAGKRTEEKVIRKKIKSKLNISSKVRSILYSPKTFKCFIKNIDFAESLGVTQIPRAEGLRYLPHYDIMVQI